MRHEQDHHQQNMKSDKIKNAKDTQSNKFELDAKPQLSQTYTAKRFSAVWLSQQKKDIKMKRWQQCL